LGVNHKKNPIGKEGVRGLPGKFRGWGGQKRLGGGVFDGKKCLEYAQREKKKFKLAPQSGKKRKRPWGKRSTKM